MGDVGRAMLGGRFWSGDVGQAMLVRQCWLGDVGWAQNKRYKTNQEISYFIERYMLSIMPTSWKIDVMNKIKNV